ncbi:hypothetical protein IMSAG025_00800 [Muribaculaceae bacterium]|nr:hypothetical protein IMSAGC016_00091 [Muribaculaceae bacterium]GFI57360.1 hypothetical protein IMSAG025_00800 [Muribaculaceae bacterium]
MALPNDPIMLYSAVNMKLRDSYPTLEELCAAEGIEKEILTDKLKRAGFEYNPEVNQFR